MIKNSYLRRKLLILLIFSAALIWSCGGQKRVTVIKLAHGLDPTHPAHKAMEFMARPLAEKSNGTMKVEIYPSQQLGTEGECLELLRIGGLGMTKVLSSVLEGFVPDFNAFSLPYIFKDEAHRFKVLESPLGKELLLKCQKYWMRGLCYYDAGSRSFYTKNVPILKPSDLDALKIRIQEGPASIKMVQALGGSATPIAWGEQYSALQQGIVDGAENNPPSFYLSHHYEVCKYYSLDEHTAVPDVLVISTEVWNDLTPDQQRILQEAVDESVVEQKKLWKEATTKALEAIQEAGVEVFYPDKEPFRRKVAGLYEAYKDQPEIYRVIQEIKAVQ